MLRWQLYGISAQWISLHSLVMSSALQTRFIQAVREFSSLSHTQSNTCTHSNSTTLTRTQKSTLTQTPIILREKEYWKRALRNSREEVGFSHFHPRLADVFLRESGAVQARSFHYQSEKALHETLPGKRGRLLIIFLLGYCQNALFLHSASKMLFLKNRPNWLDCIPSSLNVEIFEPLWYLFIHIFTFSSQGQQISKNELLHSKVWVFFC